MAREPSWCSTRPAARGLEEPVLATVAYRLNGKTTYALEGSILSAGRRFNGCETDWDSSRAPPTSRRSRVRRRTRRGLSRARIHGSGCAYWDPVHAERCGAHARLEPRGDRTGHARLGRLSDPRPARGHGGGRPQARVSQSRRRHGDERLVHAAPRRRPGYCDPTAEIAESTAFGAACLAGLGCGMYRSCGTSCSSRSPMRASSPAPTRALGRNRRMASGARARAQPLRMSAS